MRNPTHVLHPVGSAETEIRIQPGSDVVAIEDKTANAGLAQFMIQCTGDRAFAGAGKTGQPYDKAGWGRVGIHGFTRVVVCGWDA